MFLNEIILNKSMEVEIRKMEFSVYQLAYIAEGLPAPLDFAAALKKSGVGIIAEIKKASPSRGLISRNFRYLELAYAYRFNGAAAISVLTEEKYFRGSLNHLREVKKAMGYKSPPVLRKDFIIDPYQIFESRAYGADCLLLIVAALKPELLQDMMKISQRLGMSCLVEVHNEDELEIALQCNAKIIGINNRDLATFDVDMTTTERLRPLIPHDRVVISESGISTRQDMLKLKKWKVNAALIGEALMTSDDIGKKMKELKV
jgi:indole-3-glycerol phosphate synthase